MGRERTIADGKAVPRTSQDGNPLDACLRTMRLPVTIAVLFYGPHPDLCRRFLDRIYRHTPVDWFSLRVGLNAVCSETVDLVRQTEDSYGNVEVWEEERNIFKYPFMRKMLLGRQVESEWTIWYDDDSYPYRGDWLPALAMKVGLEPRVAIWGKRYSTNAGSKVEGLIRSAPWYRGRRFCYRHPDGEASSRPVLVFVEGGFWAVRSSVLRELDWPDPRLVHIGGDFVFGEALRQNGFSIGQFYSGVRINQERRRGLGEIPLEVVIPTDVVEAGLSAPEKR